MKKILFIIEGLSGGGAERALIELLKRFDYSKYSVTLCVIFEIGIYINQIPSEVKLIFLFPHKETSFQRYLRKIALRHYKKYSKTWLMHYLIAQKIKNRHFDIIISFIEGYPLIFHSLIKKKAKKNISWIHCDLYHQHWTTLYFHNQEDEKECYEKMDKLIFVSRNALKAFDTLYDIKVPKDCIYNIIDAHSICMLAKENKIFYDRFTITSIGSLYKIKGYERLIRVAKLFKDNGYSVKFQIIGDGDLLEELMQLRDRLGVQREVSFLSFQENPYPLLKQSDIFVSTSLSEGLSLVICEALVLGVPVVATKTAGAIELLDNGKYGVLTEHDDLSIYEGLKRIVDDDVLRQIMKKQSKERASMFNVNQTLQKVYDLIDE